MKTIFWLAILFIGLPVLIGLALGIYDMDSAKNGTIKKIKIYIFEIIGLGLFIWSIVDLFHLGDSFKNEYPFVPVTLLTIFPSVKSFVLFAIKFVLGIAFNAFTLIALFGIMRRKSWSSRIKKVLDSSLGEQLENQLPKDSLYYSIGLHYGDFVISFYENGNLRRIPFHSLGYEDFPAEYSDVICKWIQEYIVLEKEKYRLEKVVKTTSSWSGGSPGHIETTRTSTGYESRYVSGDPGREEIKTVILGYRLKHIDFESVKKKQELKKW